ncbi:hypothetical protein R1flu_012532 [Riccia fluitans]|uniref:CHAT domain-containing protein n=1 Tax=Riccia fluitans TaxID=41844 RepID=A0ABD1ZBW4_9MARC
MVEPPYSQGAIILKGLIGKGSRTVKASACEVVDDSSEPATSFTLIGDMFSDSENLETPRAVTTSRAPKIDEVLTAKEIANLEGGIPSGLVVLSACCTGMGMDTAEGLLGPARVVLQAGAAATIVTLFSVDDYSTKTLITDMFRVMKEQGEPALHALRHAMLNMIKEGKDISHWAPYTLIGSPTLALAQTSKTHELCDKIMRVIETTRPQSLFWSKSSSSK